MTIKLPPAPDDASPMRYWYIEATEAEKSQFRELENMMTSARSEVEKMRSAIALADVGFQEWHASLRRRIDEGSRPGSDDRSELTRLWPNIAAHAALDSLFQFHFILSKIIGWFRANSAAKFLKPPDKVTAVEGLFNSGFPQWKQTRHAAAHAAEIGSNPKRNAHRGASSGGFVRKPKGAAVMIMESFENRTFVTTRKGEFLRLDITWETYEQFLSVYRELLDATAPTAQN